jgi:hypothetical protein
MAPITASVLSRNHPIWHETSELIMNDITAIRTDVVSDTKVSPEPPTSSLGADRASGLYVVRSMDEERLPPPVRRGESRCWVPGSWGDPF